MQVPGSTALPSDLEITRSSFFPSIGWVGNVEVFGTDKTEGVTFLCNVPGDFGYSQTVVAFRSRVAITSMSALWKASEIVCERLDNWILMYRPGTEINATGLSSFVDDCRGLLLYFESTVKTTVL
jgi:hypothetical protein